jgi:hypothetical protein
VSLTRKDAEFTWGREQQQAMDVLKERVASAPALVPLDYASGRLIIVAVDSSSTAVGWIVYQMDERGRRPSRFGSIAWNERESRYSQAKIELYGVYRALRALRIYLIGLPSFQLEVDAKYIRGMLNNPDIQPNNAMNRWIAAILLFTFELVHVPGKDHAGPDGLSRRRHAEGDVEEKDDEWVDDVLGLGIWVSTWYGQQDTSRGNTSNGATTLSKPSFLAFSLNNTTIPQVEIPRTKDDIKMDEQLPLIFEFLSTLKKPSGLDETESRRFIKQASRFFVKDGRLGRKDPSGMHQLVILDLKKRLSLITQAHDHLGHKQAFSTRRHLVDRFWWPGLSRNIAWFVKTCHECQLRSTQHVFIPPVVATPAPLFQRVHIDTMHMPKTSSYQYIVQGRCSLTSYAEFKILSSETGQAVGKFIFNEILCRWGSIAEIVTDNGTPIVAALDWLSQKYHINHIRISAYNKQANGVVERSHRSIRESIVKACNGNLSRWPEITPYTFWADRVTVRKDVGYSPFYMVHGVEPILPFDVVEATFLLPKLDKLVTREELVAIRTRQLEKRQEDLELIKGRVLKARYTSIKQFEKDHANLIVDYDFTEGSLVLVRNSIVYTDLSRKTKPRYLGPLIVIRRTRNKAYILAELDGAVHKNAYAAFRLIPYYPRSRTIIPVTSIVEESSVLQEKVAEEDLEK